METESKPWEKEKLVQWKHFWESEMGVEAIAKMKTLQDRCVARALASKTTEEIQYYTGRAAGIGIVLDDINIGIRMAEQESEQKGET